jgi:hypothetical protein
MHLRPFAHLAPDGIPSSPCPTIAGLAAGLLELLGADQRHATRETDGRKKALVLSAENGPAQRTYVGASIVEL